MKTAIYLQLVVFTLAGANTGLYVGASLSALPFCTALLVLNWALTAISISLEINQYHQNKRRNRL